VHTETCSVGRTAIGRRRRISASAPSRKSSTLNTPSFASGRYVKGQHFGFGWSLFIVAVAAPVLLRYAWAPLLMLAVLIGIKTPGDMLGVLVGLVILGAAALRERLAGRRF
jgi:hypothetical protein